MNKKKMVCCSLCAKESGSIKFYEEFNKYFCNYHYEKWKEHGFIYFISRNNTVRIEEELGYAIIFISKKDTCEEVFHREDVHKILIDIEDVEKVEDYNLFLSKGYVGFTTKDNNKNKNVILSRFLLNCLDLKMHVDHINGDILDNRKRNLRVVTPSQNSMNRKLAKNNTSGVTGVVKNKNGKYIAQIRHNHKVKYLGTFDTIEEAKNARIEAEDKYFGEYSYRNSRKIKHE